MVCEIIPHGNRPCPDIPGCPVQEHDLDHFTGAKMVGASFAQLGVQVGSGSPHFKRFFAQRGLGVSPYEAVYESLFLKSLNRYSSIRKNIKSRVDRALSDPYHNTELLGDVSIR